MKRRLLSMGLVGGLLLGAVHPVVYGAEEPTYTIRVSSPRKAGCAARLFFWGSVLAGMGALIHFGYDMGRTATDASLRPGIETLLEDGEVMRAIILQSREENFRTELRARVLTGLWEAHELARSKRFSDRLAEARDAREEAQTRIELVVLQLNLLHTLVALSEQTAEEIDLYSMGLPESVAIELVASGLYDGKEYWKLERNLRGPKGEFLLEFRTPESLVPYAKPAEDPHQNPNIRQQRRLPPDLLQASN